jgi:hypothetical protein
VKADGRKVVLLASCLHQQELKRSIHLMKTHRRKKRIIRSALVAFAALTFVGSAVAMPQIEVGGSTSASTAVRPDDRAGVRGVVSVPVSQVYSEHSFSARPFGRGEHSITGASLVQASSASTGSDYNWSKTLGISAAALALALCLGGLAAVGMRHRKAPLGV